MANRRITGQRGGERHKSTRIDSGSVNFNEQKDQILREVPPERRRLKTNLVRTFLEDRE